MAHSATRPPEHLPPATQTACGRISAEQRALLLPLWRLRAHMAFVVDNLQCPQRDSSSRTLPRTTRRRARPADAEQGG